MGLSGGSKSYSGSAQKWAQPIAQASAYGVRDVVSQNAPGLQQLTSTVQGMVPGLVSRFTQGTPGLNAAKGLNTQTLQGGFLSGNPHLQSIIDTTKQNVMGDVNSQFSLAGRYGSGAHTGVLADKLAQAEAGLRYQDYGTERGYQQQAIGNAGALEGVDNQSLAALLQAIGVGAELPYTGINAEAGNLASLFSGGTQKQSTGLASILAGAGSAASGAAQAGAFSDRRLKTNIEKVGEFEDGLGKYRWNYIWDGATTHEGVMADEVETLRPWALGPTVAGFATVNYGAL